jgi:hypothetical protein
MATIAKIFIGFWIVWIIWYVTGGPLRDDKTKPFVQVSGSGTLETVGTSSVK